MTNKLLVIYDKAGNIYMTTSGYDEVPEGLSAVIIEIPEGKELVSIDTSGDTPVGVFVDAEKTKTAELEEQVNMLTECILEMSEIVYGADDDEEESV